MDESNTNGTFDFCFFLYSHFYHSTDLSFAQNVFYSVMTWLLYLRKVCGYSTVTHGLPKAR